jgi:putative hydrolase of the HAD superfamily
VSSSATVVVFDLGGVVCRWLPDRRLEALAACSGLPAATIEQLVFESGFDDAGERGRFDGPTFTEELAALLGLDPLADGDRLRTAWARAYEPVPAMLRAIDRIEGPTALLTNNGPLLEAALAEELAPVAQRFDHLLVSWRLGAAKPEPEAFERATAALGVDAPGQVVFFDDDEHNVAAAQAAGWQAHRFTTVLEVQAVLSVLGP